VIWDKLPSALIFCWLLTALSDSPIFKATTVAYQILVVVPGGSRGHMAKGWWRMT